MISDIILTGGVGIITSILSSWTTWFFARKKYNAEVDLNLVEKMEKSLEFYKNLSDDNRERLEMLSDKNNTLEGEVQELRKQILNLTMNICLDLTCIHRIREISNGKEKNRKNKQSNNSNGGCKPITTE